MIARGASIDEAERRQALSDLLERYLPALRSYLRAKWKLSVDRADDLLHTFVVRKVIEQDFVRRADRARGRFRTFLATALDRFVISEFRRERAHGGAAGRPVSFADQPTREEQAAPFAPDTFDVAWARHALGLALRRTHGECIAGGRHDVWGVFEGRVLRPQLEDAEPVPLDELVRRFDLASPEQASNLLITAKRMFARNLRAVVAEFAGADDVEEEIARLTDILSRTRA